MLHVYYSKLAFSNPLAVCGLTSFHSVKPKEKRDAIKPRFLDCIVPMKKALHPVSESVLCFALYPNSMDLNTLI